MTLREKLANFGVIPVITITKAEGAAPLARALVEGGLPVAEVTFRTPAAAVAIREMKRAEPHLMIGAGTILTEDQMNRAEQAGADFMVAPGLTEKIVEQAQQRNMPFIPGCVTASEVEQAMGLGLDLVKFFPAEAQNAREVIKALNGPYPGMRYMPTGGISLANLESYLRETNIICCGGSWIAPTALIEAGDFTQIAANARATGDKIKMIRKGPMA